MTITTKLASATMALGTLGGVGYAANHFLSSTTLGQKLKTKGHTFLNFDTNKTDDESIWTPIVKGYVAGTKKFKDLSTIAISNDLVTRANIDALKKSCANAINSTKYEEEVLLTSEQWCTNPISIKELVSKNREVLNSKEGESNYDQQWDDKVTNYLKTDAKNKIDGVNLETITNSNKVTERNKLKKGCETLENKKTYDKDFHTQLAQFKEWCSNPKKTK